MRLRALICLALLLAIVPAHAAATRTELLASQALVASGNTAKFSVTTATQIVVGADVTAVSGTSPVLDLWLQVSDDGGTTWYDMPADFTLKTANAAAAGTFVAGGRDIVDAYGTASAADFLGVYKHLAADYVRLKWIISGTSPSFTMSVSMVAK